LLHELNSADPARHDDVREDQRRLVAARELLERLRGAVRDSAFKSELAEHSGGKLGNEGVILDDQRPTEWGPGPGPGLCGSTANRQVEREGRPMIRFRFNRDCAADLL